MSLRRSLRLHNSKSDLDVCDAEDEPVPKKETPCKESRAVLAKQSTSHVHVPKKRTPQKKMQPILRQQSSNRECIDKEINEQQPGGMLRSILLAPAQASALRLDSHKQQSINIETPKDSLLARNATSVLAQIANTSRAKKRPLHNVHVLITTTRAHFQQKQINIDGSISYQNNASGSQLMIKSMRKLTVIQQIAGAVPTNYKEPDSNKENKDIRVNSSEQPNYCSNNSVQPATEKDTEITDENRNIDQTELPLSSDLILDSGISNLALEALLSMYWVDGTDNFNGFNI